MSEWIYLDPEAGEDGGKGMRGEDETVTQGVADIVVEPGLVIV